MQPFLQVTCLALEYISGLWLHWQTSVQYALAPAWLSKAIPGSLPLGAALSVQAPFNVVSHTEWPGMVGGVGLVELNKHDLWPEGFVCQTQFLLTHYDPSLLASVSPSWTMEIWNWKSSPLVSCSWKIAFLFKDPLLIRGMVWGWYRRGKWESSLGSQKFLGSLAIPGLFWTSHPLGEVPSWLPSMLGSSITTKTLPPDLDSVLLPILTQSCSPPFPTKSLLRTRCGFGSTCWKKGAIPLNISKKEFQMCHWLAQWYWLSIYRTNGPTMCHAPARLWG